MKRIISLLLCVVMTVGVCCSCTKSEKTTGKVKLKIGYWPNKDTDPEKYEVYEGYLAQMKEKYPEVEIEKDSTSIKPDVFLTLASSGQLPDMYRVAYTEPQRIIDAGYARDITDFFKKYGYEEYTNKTSLKVVERDGKYYGVPYTLSGVGMWHNMNLYEKAGLVNEDGSPKYPKTYDELAETAKIIKEKTGKAGFAIMTKDTVGGWQFMNIAWSFGVKFMKKDENGKWKATFNSPEGAAALQYVKDLKWKYDVLPENILIDKNEIIKLFATDQLAMSICGGLSWLSRPIFLFNMDKDKIASSPTPEGPCGRYSQIGGDVWMFSKEATDEQVDAAFKWLAIKGESPNLTEESYKNLEDSLKSEKEAGNIVLETSELNIWENDDRVKKINDLYAKYTNVLPYLHVPFVAENTITKSEEPIGAQKLYALLSTAMQKVLMDKDADCAKIMEETAQTFQRDVLDKETY
ncbi:MAG: extracellular solute-binding protein [Clostridia bacterium]|nr:extracellular solute-binding protein [Clostridia bacterium]